MTAIGRKLVSALAAAAASASAWAAAWAQPPAAAPMIAMTANPARACVPGDGSGYLNLDLVVVNRSAQARQVEELRALVFDARGELRERRLLWQQALGLLGTSRSIAAGQQVQIFSPFAFTSALAGTTIRYELLLSGEARPIETVVRPVACDRGPRLLLPVAGRVLVYDGFDFLSHHRRGTYGGDWFRQMGITDNSQRYGLDLVVIDAAGRYFTGDGSRTDQWLGWGRPVRAAGDGVVAALHDGQPDNVVIGTVDRYTEQPSRANPMASYGNYVLIDHGGGEFTVAAHLRNGSVRVRPGQRVRAGQEIGAIGNSGASGGVHVHFERRTGPDLAGMETLPPYFSGLRVVGRPQAPRSRRISVNTGDVLIAR